MTRRLIVCIGIVVLALVVMAYVVWWPSLLDMVATMHGQRPPIPGQR